MGGINQRNTLKEISREWYKNFAKKVERQQMSYLDVLDRCPGCDEALNHADIATGTCTGCGTSLHIGEPMIAISTTEDEQTKRLVEVASKMSKYVAYLRDEVDHGLATRAVRLHTDLRKLWSGLTKDDQLKLIQEVPTLAGIILHRKSPVLLKEKELNNLLEYIDIFTMVSREDG